MSEDDRPRGWELRVRAAFERMCGATQEDTAQKVDRTSRTIRKWENDDTWPDALEEARDRWLTTVVQEARATLLQAVREGDPIRAMQIVERMDADFAPPKQEVEHSGEIEGGDTHIYLPDNRRNEVPEAVKERMESARGNGAG